MRDHTGGRSMFLNDAKTPANADESDKREMRAKRSRF